MVGLTATVSAVAVFQHWDQRNEKMNRVLVLFRRVIRELWGEEPMRPRVWNGRTERETLDERAQWFIRR